MRLSSVLQMAGEYALLGLAAVIVVGLALGIGYGLIYRRIGKGTRVLSWKTLVLLAVFLVYLVIVIGATLLGRGGFYADRQVQPLFASYARAWAGFSKAEWRNLILNICMFVPFGMMLPWLSKRFRRFFRVYILGFMVTLVIEVLQWKLGRGIFEADDILNNTLGTMIGFGLGMLILRVGSCLMHGKRRQGRLHGKNRKDTHGRIRKCKEAKRLFFLQIPLIATVFGFCLIFGLYEHKELGNLSFSRFYPRDMKQVSVSCEAELSDQELSDHIYTVHRGTRQEMDQAAEQFFAAFGAQMDPDQTDVYDDTIVYWDTQRSLSLWMDKLGMTYQFTDFRFMEEDIGSDFSDAQVLDLLRTYGITFPWQVSFSQQADGSYQTKTEMMAVANGCVDGSFSCSFTKDGEPKAISNQLRLYAIHRECGILSQQEAYERLCRGYFSYEAPLSELVVTDVSLDHMPDSKGYVQPVYVFAVRVNGERVEEIWIPALL